MNEEQLREGLRAAVANEPPLGLDPDQATEHARRALRRRRATVGSVAASVLVIGAVATAVGLAGPASTNEQAAGPPVETEHRAQLLIDHVVETLPDVVPGAHDIWVEQLHDETGSGELRIEFSYRDPDGAAALEISLSGTTTTYCGQGDGCDEYQQPDGSTVAIAEYEAVRGGNATELGQWVRRAEHRRDTMTVLLSTYNYELHNPRSVVRAAFFLTDEQLIELVTDPALDAFGPIRSTPTPPAPGLSGTTSWSKPTT